MTNKKHPPPQNTRRNFLKVAATGGIAGTTVLGATTLAAPAFAQGKRQLKMVTAWPKNFPGLGTRAQEMADHITSASDGKLSVKVYAAGELVPAFEVFDAVSNGTADLYHAAEYYWPGKHKGFNFFSSVPFGLTAPEMNAWLNYGGGQELWDELSARFNVKAFAAANTGVQMGGWFNREINSIDDFKGLKMRIPGLGGEVLRRVGAAAISIPGGEIYASLQSGAIDATEFVGPWNDLALGFYKVAKYYYYPGFHEAGTVLSCGINKELWDSLPAGQKSLIRAACAAHDNFSLSEYNAKNGDALDTLINKHNVKLRKFSTETATALFKASEQVLAEVAQTDEMTQKIYDSFVAFRTKAAQWTNIADSAYTKQRDAALKSG